MFTTTLKTSVYESFAAASKQLYDIAPIDYFFAKEHVDDLVSDSPISTASMEAEEVILTHLLIALSQSVREGHTCLPLGTIANHSYGIKSDETGVISHHGYVFPDSTVLTELVENIDIKPDHNKGIVCYRGSLYMRRNYSFERELEQQLHERNSSEIAYQESDIESCIEHLFPHSTSNEIDWQQVAVANSLNKCISVIAGGPGTGKTYTVTKLLAAILMLKPQSKISLVAPTGKAAQRLNESITNAVAGFTGAISQDVLDHIPTEAKTLHRFLGVIPNQLQFKHNKDNLIDVDVVILDEVSMVDLALMTRLFRALPQHTQVIMLGDAEQLPSVALGSVLADIAPKPHPGYSDSNLDYLGKFVDKESIRQFIRKANKHWKDLAVANHLSFLYQSRRFDGEGGIGKLAKAVIEGDAEQGWKLLQADSVIKEQSNELTFEIDFEETLPRFVEQFYKPLLSETDISKAFKQLALFRILVASRKGGSGVEAINEKVIQLLGKSERQNQKLFHGMPLMVSENSYSLGLYNGDVGIVWRMENSHLMVVFECPEQGYRYVMPTRLPNFEPVYAMTIHKTQGSEFDHVYIVLSPQQDNKLLSRELLYTGITRAKRKLTLTGLHRVWFSGVETKIHRYSNLSIC